MAWYYAEGSERIGPLTEEEFQAAVAQGKVGGATLVWREGMKDWAPFGTTGFSRGASVPAPESGSVVCAECGRSFPADEVIAYAGKHVCGGCKAIFFQRIKEGAALPGEFDYAGVLDSLRGAVSRRDHPVRRRLRDADVVRERGLRGQP